jgi:uncharacterized membrane protein
MAGKKAAGKAAPAKAAPVTVAPAAVSDGSKLLAALGYIIVILIPLYVLLTDRKDDKFLAFHAWQAVILQVAVFIAAAVVWFGIAIIAVFSYNAAELLCCPAMILVLAAGLYGLFLTWKAYQGEKALVPLIGDYALERAGGK